MWGRELYTYFMLDAIYVKKFWFLPFQPLSLDACLDSATSFAPYLKLHLVGRINKDTISAGANPERKILVCLVTGSSSIRIPQGHCLPYFVKRSESFSQAMN